MCPLSSASGIVPPRAKASVWDSLKGRVMATFYGDENLVLRSAETFVGSCDGVSDGRYGIDYSIHCDECSSYHSPEADC